MLHANVWTPERLGAIVPRLDSAEVATISRDLLYVLAKVYEVQRLPLRHRMIIPISYEVPTGASSFSVESVAGVGAANFSNDGDPVNYVDEFATEELHGIKTCRAGWRYTLQEQRGNDMARRGRIERLAMRARYAIEQQLAGIAFNGSGTLGGFLNGSGVPNTTATTGTWASATPDEILADVTDLIQAVRANSKGLFEANSVVLPLTAWNALERPRHHTDTTLLKWLAANFPGVSFTWANELETAGTGTTRMALAFNRDPMNVALFIPQEFETLPPMDCADHLQFISRLRTGGVVWHQPLAGAQIYGI